MKNSPKKLARPLLILALISLMAITALSIGAAPGASSDGIDGQAPPAPSGKTQSYVVLMEGLPLVASEGDIKGMPATKPAKGKKVNPNSKAAKKYDAHLKGNQKKAQREAGVSKDAVTNTYTVALNGFSAVMTEAQVEEMRSQEGVTLVLKDEWRQPETDSSPDFLGLTGPAGPWQTGFDGEGVVVGVIDSGIWPEHPSFADDGSYAPVPPLDNSRPSCEFGNTTQNPNDAPFDCNNKLIGARQMLDTYRALIGATPDEYDSARDDHGHGTHTASTAAGNAGVLAKIYGIPRGTISGIAPRAQVIAYKGLGNLGGFTSDLAAAIDQAVIDGVDVINYSIGTAGGGPGADAIAFLSAAQVGVFVTKSVGNSGPDPATVTNPGTMPWVTTVGANTQRRFWQGTVFLGDGSQVAGASITPGVGEVLLVDAADAGGDLCYPGTLDPSVIAGNIVLCRRGAIARTAKSLAVYQAGGVGMIMYENSDDNSLFSDTHWVPSVQVDNTPGLAIKAYVDSAGSAATAEIVAEQVGEWNSAPSMAYFSSRGPNHPAAADIIKPDITAPGIQILAGYPLTPDPGSTPPDELFAAISGTSMSSAQVAGAFALIKQAHPDWSAAIAKSAIMTTAYQEVVDNDRISQADPFDMGSGHLKLGNAVHKGSAFQPGLAYDAGSNDYLGFLCDAFPENLVDPVATCSYLDSIGVPTDASSLNYPSIGIAELAGTQTIQRTVTSVANENGWRDYTVSIDAPPGYDVAVIPSNLSLKYGQSATYEVTITNAGAPVGEWRFGSLTWSDDTGHYDVYSPIAVHSVSIP